MRLFHRVRRPVLFNSCRTHPDSSDGNVFSWRIGKSNQSWLLMCTLGTFLALWREPDVCSRSPLVDLCLSSTLLPNCLAWVEISALWYPREIHCARVSLNSPLGSTRSTIDHTRAEEEPLARLGLLFIPSTGTRGRESRTIDPQLELYFLVFS